MRQVASTGEPEKEAAWEKAWQEGQAMSIEDAIDYALVES